MSTSEGISYITTAAATTAPSSSSISRAMSEVSTKDSFIICAIVMVSLVTLVAIRIVLELVMEAVCFDRYANQRRTIFRCLFPCCCYCHHLHRTAPTPSLSLNEYSTTATTELPTSIPLNSTVINNLYNENTYNNANNINTINIDPLHASSNNSSSVTINQRRDILLRDYSFITELLKRILPGKILNKNDILKLRNNKLQTKIYDENNLDDKALVPTVNDGDDNDDDNNKANTNNIQMTPFHDHDAEQATMTIDSNHDCSICLHDFVPDDLVYITNKCRHAFHADCIRSWVGKPSFMMYSNNQNNFPVDKDKIPINNHCPNCRCVIFEKMDEILSLIRTETKN